MPRVTDSQLVLGRYSTDSPVQPQLKSYVTSALRCLSNVV